MSSLIFIGIHKGISAEAFRTTALPCSGEYSYLSTKREREEKERMNMKVVGKERVDYPSKKTGKQVTGISFNCVMDTTSDRFEGMRVDTVFVSSKSPMYDQCVGFPVGCEISVMYNRYGSVESVLLCDQKK